MLYHDQSCFIAVGGVGALGWWWLMQFVRFGWGLIMADNGERNVGWLWAIMDDDA